MNLWFGLQVGLKEIWAHKFRSFLTMLGVVLGVASLLSMFALTAGIAKGMRELLESTGGVERVLVSTKDVSERLQEMSEISPGRTMADVQAIREGVPLVDCVSPESRLDSAAVTFGNKTTRTMIIGTVPEFAVVAKYDINHGRMLAPMDVENTSRVAVIAASIVEELWGSKEFDPVGKTILINHRPFQVVGTFPFYETEESKRRRSLGLTAAEQERREKRGRKTPKTRGVDPFFVHNHAVVIPITAMFSEFKSAQQSWGGEDQGPNYKLDTLAFRVANLQRFEETIEQVRTVLEATHRGIDDFSFDTKEDWFDQIESGVSATRRSGGLIAGISLLVGGIGITNIMLASITERIREIGVRRAVGARGRDIFGQIIVESSVIGVIGGVLGLLIGVVMMRVLVWLSPTNMPVLEWSSMAISFGFAVVVGVLSGIYPATTAARLDPIEALRYG